MKRYRVRLAERAEAHLEKIAAWWEEHRREHPNLVAEELRDAMSTLAAFPLTGPRFRSRFARGARRMRIPRSHRSYSDQRLPREWGRHACRVRELTTPSRNG